MADATFDVLGIGNALVDVLSHEDDGFIEEMGLERGAATMVDAGRSEAVYRRLGPGVEVSGGSAANTVAGVASFGGRPAYVGKVAEDQLGIVFRHDLRAQGVSFETPASDGAEPTGRCLVIVSPDAQRTMCTHLGVAQRLGPEDIDADLVAASKVTYVEGFLWDEPSAKEAIVLAFEIASANGRRVAMSLSDPFCVERHRKEFLGLLDHVDILFANEAEITSLFGTGFDAATAAVAEVCEHAALTRGPAGSVVLEHGSLHRVEAVTVDDVVDTTGAGDLYAAGVLTGLTRGLDSRTSGELGSVAAAEVISHLGARPTVRLDHLARQTLGDVL
ncbi:MAG: adenosine kinase [Actinobacteria bacterium ATB1]|nr:adenosine kinase [Actinobacteria bacterium ATB1]